jgi:hypothetical protein
VFDQVLDSFLEVKRRNELTFQTALGENEHAVGFLQQIKRVVQTFKDGFVVFSNGKSADKSEKSSFFKFWKKHHGKEGPFPNFLMKDENQKSVPPTLMITE